MSQVCKRSDPMEPRRWASIGAAPLCFVLRCQDFPGLQPVRRLSCAVAVDWSDHLQQGPLISLGADFELDPFTLRRFEEMVLCQICRDDREFRAWLAPELRPVFARPRKASQEAARRC